MASPGRTEPESVPIWLKLSEADAAQLDQVLARPEFAGWTKAEWCLEIIQTALRYYAKRPVAEPGRARSRTRPAAPEPEPPPPAPEPESAAPQPRRAAPRRKPVAPRSKRATSQGEPVAPEPGRAAPELGRAAPELGRAAPELGRAAPEPEQTAPEPTRADLDPEPPVAAQESLAQAECPHPADARDYQTGTCAACGAILWD
jgi:hypothetical protein